ncbi:MAG: PEP-CTERM sorting domain-containing protein [Planctomycetota bacterium]|nr:PEP-CTERM sorting domain-containing protein [Planctomycetota bacterium]
MSLSIALGSHATSQADYLTVFGGPTYNSTSQTGYLDPRLNYHSGAGVSSTAAVGTVRKYVNNVSLGQRPYLWDTTGAAPIELGVISTATNGVANTHAVAINDTGTVAGFGVHFSGNDFIQTSALRWDAGTTVPTLLGGLGLNTYGLPSGSVRSMNSSGTIAGLSEMYIGGHEIGTRAVRWDPSGTEAIELGNIGTHSSGYTRAQAEAINDAGTIVGSSEKYINNLGSGWRPVRWDAGSTVAVELGVLGPSDGNSHGRATFINQTGIIVGEVYNGSGRQRAVRWDAGSTVAIELGLLSIFPPSSATSTPYGINASGTIVGSASASNMGGRAIRWDAGSTVAVELPALGGQSSQAQDINDAGLIVGRAQITQNLQWHAMLWDAAGVGTDLNTLIDPASGWTLTEAQSIGSTGLISGIGMFDPDLGGPLPSYERMYLLDVSTIPEPSTICLFGLGLLGMTGVAVRKRKLGAD